MKKSMIVTILIMAFASSIAAASANENPCKGDALRSTPPVPNYPTHVRNIIWRNTRALCLVDLSRIVNHPSTSSLKKPVDQKAVPRKL